MVQQPRPIAGKKLLEGIYLGGAVPMSLPEPDPLGARGWRNRDAGGIGLAIVVALEKGPCERARKLHSTAPIVTGYQRNSPFACLPGMYEFGAASCRASRAPSLPQAAVSTEEFCVADFLSSCHLCRKKLLGKDIYMYREKAFCSEECRHQRMASDEHQEKYSTRTPKRSAVVEIASSPCSGGQLFFTGIAVS